MLKTIIAKEFLNNIINLRFMVGLVLCVIITVACIIILSHDYQQELADYNCRVGLQAGFLSKPVLEGFVGRVTPGQKPPERFRPLIIGIPGNETKNSLDENPLAILFPRLDFLFIVTIVMSLLALLFFQQVSGKEPNDRQRDTGKQAANWFH